MTKDYDSEVNAELTFLRKEFKSNDVFKLAIAEDEAVRQASRQRSQKYLERVEDETSGTPFWMWCVLYFILGMFFNMTVDLNVAAHIDTITVWLNSLGVM